MWKVTVEQVAKDMEQSFIAALETLQWNRKVHYRVHKSPSLNQFLIHVHPVDTIATRFIYDPF
jgi:hypothetical protein